ncbi:hypothetical protein ACDA63_01680 [Uliginosibacterium sp. sgz301328]|uniref:hypothetical protein n=1 Tax=Uliginosibacterium sp. sgz301328 TaxID=3243764 RepID=UPI00359D90BC
MRFYPRALPDELPGDHLIRKTRRSLLYALLCLLISAPVYIWMGRIWWQIAQLGGFMFVGASMLFGLGMVIGPLGGLFFGLVALFMRVESRFAPRATPLARADSVAVPLGWLATLLPALAACYPPIKALIDGSIRYKFPAGQVARSVDPLGYWQGVAFWFMGAAALAVLAGVYWRSRYRKLKAVA